jgi:predicted dehydrogenase
VAESNTHPYDYSSDSWTFAGSSLAVEREIHDVLREFRSGPEGYDAQFIGIHAALNGAAECPVTVEEARASIELATALYISADTRRMVELPIPPRPSGLSRMAAFAHRFRGTPVPDA